MDECNKFDDSGKKHMSNLANPSVTRYGSFPPADESPVLIDEKESSASNGNVVLKKQVGLVSAVAIIAGTVIGSGIFVSPKGVLQESGSVGQSLIIWAACGLYTTVAAIAYAEIGTTIPKSGGEYTYFREVLGAFPAFVYIWLVLLVALPSSGAIVCLTFATYTLGPFFDDCGPPEIIIKLLASAVLILIGIINCWSVKFVTRIQVIFTVAKIAAVLMIAIGGIVELAKGKTEHISDGFKDSITTPASISFAFYQGLFAYSGWNNITYITEEIRDVHRTLPRAILIALPLVTILYVTANISYLTVISKEALLASDAVAVTWADRVLFSAAFIIPVAVACSTYGNANGAVLARSRLAYSASREGHLPELISLVNTDYLTPMPAVIFTVIMSIIMVVIGDISSLINAVGFVSQVAIAGVMITLLILRYKKPDIPRPFKVPIVIPVFVVLVSSFLTIAPIIQDPRLELLYMLGFVGVGVLVYFPVVHFNLSPPFMKSFTTWAQLLFQAVPGKLDKTK